MATQSTADLTPTTLTMDQLLFPVAGSTTIYDYENTGVNASGFAVPMSDSAAIVFQGYAGLQANNSAGGNGAISVPVTPLGVGASGENRFYIFNATGATQAWVGTLALFTTDNSVANSGTSHANVAGMIVQLIDSTHVLVDTMRRTAA